MKLVKIAIPLAFLLVASASQAQLYQYGSISAILAGSLKGSSTYNDVSKSGTNGLGSVEGLFGEATQIDGVFYDGHPAHMTKAGRVTTLDSSGTTPFFVTFKFTENKKKCELGEFKDQDEFEAKFIAQCAAGSPNYFYGIKSTSTVDSLTLKSSPDYKIPAARVDTVHTNAAGTLVGYYAPFYNSALTVPGVHLHFVSADKTYIGHAVELSSKKVTLEVERFINFTMVTPTDPGFEKAKIPPRDGSVFRK
jgi:acetolactate decarboxylase